MPEFQNPNLQSQGGGAPGTGGGGGGMQSMLVMMFLFIAVLLGFQYFQKPKPATPPANQSAQQQSAANQSAPSEPAATATTSTQSAAKPGSAPAPSAAPAIVATSETETTVENAYYRIVLSNRGALVKHWILKDPHYKDSTQTHQLDMVQQQASQRFGFPLSLFTYEPALTTQLNQALYQPSATGTVQAPNSITFHYAQNGLDVLKTFRFDTTYVVSADVQVHRNGQPVRALVSWPAGLGDMEEFQSGGSGIPGFSRTPSQFLWSLGGKQDSVVAAKVSNNATLDGDYQYAATSDLYFAAAFLPDAPERATVVTLHNTVDLPTDPSNPNSQKKPADVIGLAVGDTSGNTRLRLYAGPKQMDIVSSIHSIGADGKPDGPTLESLIQFGSWLGVIAKPLFLALRFLHEHGIPNWGWAIIIVTALFNMILLPTRLMMMKSSLKMMRIQPEVDRIKRKYSNLKTTDPKRAEMNAEMMALYKEHGVNMYGGCLPLLIQMPLFFAYFRVLQNTVELRQSHWFWLHDLSAPDPLYILPILIIGTMFLTQFITPSPGMDPTQRKMMAFIMPLFFGYTLMHYASGLALYWCTGNLINLAIQLSINQSHIGKEMHAIAAKRAAKRAGKTPPTIQGRR